MSATTTKCTIGLAALAAAAVMLGVPGTPAIQSRLQAAAPGDAALASFIAAASPAEAARAVDAVVKSGASFDAVYAALRAGRVYRPDAPTGLVKGSHEAGGLTFNYQIEVPPSYDPSKRYQMRVQLHGGVGRPDPTPRGSGIGQLAGAEQIYLLPTAWAEAEWWTDSQLDNLRTLIDSVKRRYNVDENRIVLSGVSDGGTATYYFSMRDTTPFAAFLPLNGAVAVLRNTLMRVDGELFMNNMVNKPFFIVNGGKDPLYPTSLVEPYINQMTKGGVDLTYRPQPEAAHNTVWWPQLKDEYEAFVTAHPRNPYPDAISWESDLRDGTGRAHWLVIDTLDPTQKEGMPLPDINEQLGPDEPDFGVRVSGARITGVVAGSNADTFGLVPGDVVAKIDNRVLPGAMDATQLLDLIDPGTPTTLTVTRNGQTIELKGTYQPTRMPRRDVFFVHTRPSGRVDLTREGNTVKVTTRHVAAFTLLLSPDQFDFSRPVTVIADGKTVFEGTVKPSLATLLKWAATDNDRTMLFGAELPIALK
jgi:poly(3-hydroxybutyrate) depolymerase